MFVVDVAILPSRHVREWFFAIRTRSDLLSVLVLHQLNSQRFLGSFPWFNQVACPYHACCRGCIVCRVIHVRSLFCFDTNACAVICLCAHDLRLLLSRIYSWLDFSLVNKRHAHPYPHNQSHSWNLHRMATSLRLSAETRSTVSPYSGCAIRLMSIAASRTHLSTCIPPFSTPCDADTFA